MKDNIKRSAEFTGCGRHRISLTREWDGSSRRLVVVGLNPSTAGAEEDDPTIRRVVRFAKDNGYGSIVMVNLYSTVSTDPDGETLVSHEMNELELEVRASAGDDVLFAWGAHPSARLRQYVVSAMFPNALCLGRTASGAPKHPLYLKATTPMEPFHGR